MIVLIIIAVLLLATTAAAFLTGRLRLACVFAFFSGMALAAVLHLGSAP